MPQAGQDGQVQIDGGHSFVGFAKIDVKKNNFDYKAYGFYPAKGRDARVMTGKDVKGNVRDDSNHPRDRAYVFSVSKTQYDKAMQYAEGEKQNPGNYNLLTNNCVNFTANVFKAAGISIPEGGLFGVGANPAGESTGLEILTLLGAVK
jgi:hypothetical protein